MNVIIEIAKWLLPSLMVFLAVWIVFNHVKNSDKRRYAYELRLKEKRAILPARLQAHERMMLFLERISPEALIMRLQRPNLTVQQLHSMLLKTIRQEWDHNVAQQLYLSDKAWTLIKNSCENIVKLINTEAGKLKPSDPAMQLSQKILEECSGERPLTADAIRLLKEEVRNLF